MGGLELVGTVEFKDGSIVKILRQFDPVVGFQYFLEEGGRLRSFDAYGEREYEFRMPYPVMLDRWMDENVWPAVHSVSLKVYHIEDDEWGEELGGQKIREWCEKALRYYEGEEEIGFWREYWGLLNDERDALSFFFEKFFREEENASKREWWELRAFRRTIFGMSLGEYREKLADNFIKKLSYVLDRDGKSPRNIAKGLLVWLDEHNADMRDFLNGLYEWDYLTLEERGQMCVAIYDRLEEMAEEEEDWAGLSLEEWLDLLKKELIKRREIKDDAGFWKLLKRYVDRGDLYNLLDWVLEENVDWYWMPRKEKKELASALEEFIIDKLEEMSESTA